MADGADTHKMSTFKRDQGIGTYWAARTLIDKIMNKCRLDALAELEAKKNAALKKAVEVSEKMDVEPQYQSHRRALLRCVNAAWQLTIDEMARAVLPKRPKSKSRKTVRTLNWRLKAVPSMSQSVRRAKGKKRRSKARSHVKGGYVPINAPEKRGRPKISDAEKKRRRAMREAKRRAEKSAATNAARIERGWKPYRRARKSEFRKGWWDSERKKRAARGRALRQARAEIAATKKPRKDKRKNHRKELDYSAPKPRRRRTSAQVAARGYSKRSAKIRSRGNKLGTAGIIAMSAFRAARATRRRIAGAREYWRRVKKRALEIASGPRKVGRPLGSGDKQPRKKRVGGNAGSFKKGGRGVNEALVKWREEKEAITKELRSWIGLQTWNLKRRSAYRNDAEKRAGIQQSINHRNAKIEAARAKLRAHWQNKPR